MFHSRIMNNKINPILERALRLVYSDHVSEKDRSFSTSLFTVFLQVLWKMSSILTQIFHTTLGHTATFILEIQKECNMEQKLNLT